MTTNLQIAFVAVSLPLLFLRVYNNLLVDFSNVVRAITLNLWMTSYLITFVLN